MSPDLPLGAFRSPPAALFFSGASVDASGGRRPTRAVLVRLALAIDFFAVRWV